MPLPTVKIPMPVGYVDRDGNIRQETVPVKDTGYRPTAEYYPTMRVVKCSLCGGVGVAEFSGGLNIREADRLMAGKPIPGTCLRCGRQTELVPLPVDEKTQGGLRHYYHIQRSLDALRAHGGRVRGANPVIWPWARVEAYARWCAGGKQQSPA